MSENGKVGHLFSDGPLPFARIVDCGIVGYHEFACSKATFEWLLAGGMTSVDGIPVRLQLVGDCVGGHNVFVKAWPAETLLRPEDLLREQATA